MNPFEKMMELKKKMGDKGKKPLPGKPGEKAPAPEMKKKAGC